MDGKPWSPYRVLLVSICNAKAANLTYSFNVAAVRTLQQNQQDVMQDSTDTIER